MGADKRECDPIRFLVVSIESNELRSKDIFSKVVLVII